MKTKKLLSLLVAVIVFTSVVAVPVYQAAADDTSDESAVEYRTVTDLTGAEIEVPVEPHKVAVLPDAICSLSWILMDGGDNMLCLTESSKNSWETSLGHLIYPDMADHRTDILENMEELAAAGPDLVITMTASETGGDWYADQNAQLEALGIPAYGIPSDALYADPIAVIEAMGDLLNCQDRAAQLVQYMEETDAAIEEKQEEIAAAEKQRVYNSVWVDDMKAWTAGSINGQIINALQAENISQDSASSTAFTMEEILSFDPQVLILSFTDYTPQDFYDNNVPGQDWSATSAVMNHQVYSAPSCVQSWAQSFSVEKFLYKRWMASVLYPEIFPMSETEEYISNYLKDYYGFEITEDQLKVCMRYEQNGME